MSQSDIVVNTKIRHITPPTEELQSIPSAHYNCEICGLQVKTQSNLRAHYIKTHGLVNDAKDIAFLLRRKTDISDIFHCPDPACKYTKSSGIGFSKFWHLKQHYQLVHMRKTFQCTTCNQRFSTPSAQAYHAKSCGTQFECPVCGRKYKAKKFLNQHARRSGHDIRNRAPGLRNTSGLKHQSINLPTGSTSFEGEQQGAPVPTRLAILPLLILPLGIGADQAAVSAATASAASLVSEVVSQLRPSLTVLPPLVSAPSSAAALGPPAPLASINYGQNADIPHLSSNFGLSNNAGSEAGGGGGGGSGPTFVPLVDVGTATLRLSHAHTQTDVNVPVDCPMPVSAASVAARQTDFVVLYNHQMTRDSYTATSPPECHLPAAAHMSVGSSPPPRSFLPDITHTSTYMSPGQSIELQYPEMNSNGTMTTYHSHRSQQAQPLEQHHAFQQTTAIPTTTAATGAPLYLSPGSSLPDCYGGFGAPDADALPFNGTWRGMRRADGQSANSVAVETTLDLDNFDSNSSGNCFWPPTESFSHMQTQTVCDADSLEQWFNNVQTQTSAAAASNHLQQQSNWTSPFVCDGVCVGVNTEILMTPEHRPNS